jgi:hypothetical protein
VESDVLGWPKHSAQIDQPLLGDGTVKVPG